MKKLTQFGGGSLVVRYIFTILFYINLIAEPYLLFWEGNDATQDRVCKIYLTVSGNIWKTFNKDSFRGAGCDNDEARSMQICNAQKDTEIWVYDDGNLRDYTDDYAQIKVLENIIDCLTINTFERSIETPYVKVEYNYGGNLDGKVSSMKYRQP